ncbi:PLC-like phosphodiesterase [Coemansia spiralis]|nr:PLC-like phosphodiesterase [Coemansia spiralis]
MIITVRTAAILLLTTIVVLALLNHRPHLLASAPLLVASNKPQWKEPRKAWHTLTGARPRLIGHRGEKAFMPEHTRASYWQAALESADYIEPDLAVTQDGHLVVNHNEWLGDNTNVAEIPALAHLRANKTWDTGEVSMTKTNEWFIADLTLEQIRMLRVRQDPRYPWRPSHFDNVFGVLTFAEYLELISELTARLGRPFGVVPELKSPKLYNRDRPPHYFEDQAIRLLSEWANSTEPFSAGLGPVWQSFDQDTAEYLAAHTSIPVASLVENQPRWFTPTGLNRLARFARIIAPWKDFFVAGAESVFLARNITWNSKEIEKLGGFIKPSDLAREIHQRGMEIAAYTFYDERQQMGYTRGFKNREEELFYFFTIGVDYLFVENIVEARVLRQRFGDLLI